MGLTLDELCEIKSALEFGKFVDSYLDECEEAIRLIRREIKLKTIDPVTGKRIDVSGNPIFDGE